ncbi:MAG TPA: phosphatase PAP2 family protein [Longimicrobiaceae bacterium]|nr:phosphatase PAP2 family protein [Longimicrobiaceae bacterium]
MHPSTPATGPHMDFLFGPEPIAAVQRLFGPGWVPFFKLVSLLGSNWGVILGLGIAVWLRGRRTAYALAGALAVEGVVNVVLNRLFHVPRPHHPSIVVYEQVPLSSFPSGHVFTAAVVWGALWLYGGVPAAAAALAVLAVAVARLGLGVHFLGDVLGGLAFAAALLLPFRWLWPRVLRWAADRPFGFFAWAGALSGAAALASTRVIGDNEYEWGATGIAVGMISGLLADARWLRFDGGPGSAGRRAARLLLGSAGVAAAFLAAHRAGPDALVVQAAAAGAATLWATLLAPALFARTGLGAREGEAGGPAPARPASAGAGGSAQGPGGSRASG